MKLTIFSIFLRNEQYNFYYSEYTKNKNNVILNRYCHRNHLITIMLSNSKILYHSKLIC